MVITTLPQPWHTAVVWTSSRHSPGHSCSSRSSAAFLGRSSPVASACRFRACAGREQPHRRARYGNTVDSSAGPSQPLPGGYAQSPPCSRHRAPPRRSGPGRRAGTTRSPGRGGSPVTNTTDDNLNSDRAREQLRWVSYPAGHRGSPTTGLPAVSRRVTAVSSPCESVAGVDRRDPPARKQLHSRVRATHRRRRAHRRGLRTEHQGGR